MEVAYWIVTPCTAAGLARLGFLIVLPRTVPQQRVFSPTLASLMIGVLSTVAWWMSFLLFTSHGEPDTFRRLLGAVLVALGFTWPAWFPGPLFCLYLYLGWRGQRLWSDSVGYAVTASCFLAEYAWWTYLGTQ